MKCKVYWLIVVILLLLCSNGKGEEMICECGKKMIKRYSNTVLLSNPPQYPWLWWCGCGKTRKGGVERGKTIDEIYMEEWETLNGGE